jgi:hypothetical protein
MTLIERRGLAVRSVDQRHAHLAGVNPPELQRIGAVTRRLWNRRTISRCPGEKTGKLRGPWWSWATAMPRSFAFRITVLVILRDVFRISARKKLRWGPLSSSAARGAMGWGCHDCGLGGGSGRQPSGESRRWRPVFARYPSTCQYPGVRHSNARKAYRTKTAPPGAANGPLAASRAIV